MRQFFTDQMQNKIGINFPPERIVSLVPSQTELLADLGLDQQVVGITKYCVHPGSWQKTKTVVGGTKNFDPALIISLKPDLVIGNKEENCKTGIEQLSDIPVWMSDISNRDEAMGMIKSIGEMTERIERASNLISSMDRSFSRVVKFDEASVLYLIWRRPWMAAGTDTFISSMLNEIGLKNVIAECRYPELSDGAIRHLRPDYVFLSSEPYPFKQKHLAELKALLPESKTILVDGEMFSWYGSRLLKSPDYFATLKASLP